jgi:hypothetical protein
LGSNILSQILFLKKNIKKNKTEIKEKKPHKRKLKSRMISEKHQSFKRQVNNKNKIQIDISI